MTDRTMFNNNHASDLMAEKNEFSYGYSYGGVGCD